jgi:hypothetical protein
VIERKKERRSELQQERCKISSQRTGEHASEYIGVFSFHRQGDA